MDLGLTYNPFYKNLIHITVLSEGSFSGNNDGSSQVGLMIFQTDKHHNTSLIYYSSEKGKRFARYVLSAETFGLLSKRLKIKILTSS